MRTGRSSRRVRLRGAGSRCGSRFRSAMSRFASPRSRAAGGARQRTSTTSSACPRASRPRVVAAHEDAALARKIAPLARGFSGTTGVYVQSLTGGGGAAWNARARFPGASTMKLAIAAAVLARHTGIPAPGSQVSSLLSSMLTHSDNASANALEVWLGGSTSAGSQRVNELMRSIGMRDSEMYGGYELRTLASRIPVRVEQQPAYVYGKHTTAWDIATLLRAVWLASGGRGPLRVEQPGFTRRRRPLPPLAPRARQRRAEARSRSCGQPRRRRHAQGRVGKRRTPRLRARLLARRRLRRERDDVELAWSRRIRGRARGQGRDASAGAVPPRGRLSSTQHLPRSVQFLNQLRHLTSARKREP